MLRKTREAWTADDSQRELQKWVASSTQLDPIVRETQETLSENMWFFLDNIGERCERYRAALRHVVARNPQNTMTKEQLEHSLDIPDEEKFLNVRLRRFVEVAAPDDDEEKKSPKSATSNSSEKKDSGADVVAPAKAEDEAAAVANDDTLAKTEDGDAAEVEEDDDDDDEDRYDPVDDIEVHFPCNKELVDQMKLLKQAGTELSTVFDGIADWIALSVPDIMIDDNDSVDVMKSVLDATQAHSEAVETTATYHREYLDERADLEVDIIAFPHSSSLRRQMLINDLESWGELERGWQTLIRCSLIIHTLLGKNMKKLLNPRNSSRSAGIYQ